MENCSRLEQFEMFENESMTLAKMDRGYLEQTTRCLFPCSYSEYIVKGKKPMSGLDGFGLYITFGSLSVTVRKEVMKILLRH